MLGQFCAGNRSAVMAFGRRRASCFLLDDVRAAAASTAYRCASGQAAFLECSASDAQRRVNRRW
jgi:hypothetical protein